jgi:hypothetical protein
MRLILLTILVLFSTFCFSQKRKTAFKIDSVLKSSPGLENFRYWYGSGHIFWDFRMDTLSGKLTRHRFTSEGHDTVKADYFFVDNYLVKVRSFKLKNGQEDEIGTYYLENNEVVYRTGRNVRLAKKGYFRKIAPKYFYRQLDYIYYQYEYLNPSKTRFLGNVPDQLELIRKQIDKRNSYYN